MKKAFLFLLVILPLYFLISIYLLDKSYFICPINYSQDRIIRSDNRGNGIFGAERNGNRQHEGIDFLAKVGIPVLASRSGKVIAATQSRGMGKYVIIKHTGNLITIYGHLSQIYVRKGNYVRQGEVIGSAGKTGNANYRDIQPHLHFEIRRAGVPEDPLDYLE